MNANRKIKIKQNRRDKILSGKYPIMLDDQVFKFVFSHEEMAKYLLNALSDYLNLDLKYGAISTNPQEIDMADSVLKQDFFRDILITTDKGDILLFESYTKFGSKEYRKSEAYLDKISSGRFEKNNKDNFTSDNMVICFNFVPKKGTKKKFIKKYGVVDLETLKEPFKKINDYKQMFTIMVDLNETKVYNEDERLIPILDFMNKKEMGELEELAKGGNEFMEQALKYVQSYLDNDANKGYGSHWDYDVEEAREEGEKAGRKANQIATAKRMLADGMNLEKTSEYTGLSIKVLEKLKIK